MKKTLLTLTLFISCGSGFSATADTCYAGYCKKCTCGYMGESHQNLPISLFGAPYPVFTLPADQGLMVNWCLGGTGCDNYCKTLPAPSGTVNIYGTVMPYPKPNGGNCT